VEYFSTYVKIIDEFWSNKGPSIWVGCSGRLVRWPTKPQRWENGLLNPTMGEMCWEMGWNMTWNREHSTIDNQRGKKKFKEKWWCLKTALQHLTREHCNHNIKVHVAHFDLHHILDNIHDTILIMTQGVSFLYPQFLTNFHIIQKILSTCNCQLLDWTPSNHLCQVGSTRMINPTAYVSKF